MSSSKQQLRNDIGKLKELFPKEHSRFQIVSANTDEFAAKFLLPDVGENSQKCVNVFANFQDDYPRSPSFWSSDSEEQHLVDLLGQLSGQPQPILQQISTLLQGLCRHYELPVPPEVVGLVENGGKEDHDEEEEEGEEEDHDNEELILEEGGSLERAYKQEKAKKQNELESIPGEVLAQLERLSNPATQLTSNNEAATTQQNSRTKQAQKTNGGGPGGGGSGSTSVMSLDRLMKEFKALFMSDGYKQGVFSMELLNDNLYEWHIKLMKVDEDSPLAADLRKLTELGQPGHLLFHVIFPKSFPFEPPFVRLVSPILRAFTGHLTRAGAVCMELLTKQGWSSAYSIETLITQLGATLVIGEARVEFDKSRELMSVYTLENARASYDNLVRIHGWDGAGTFNGAGDGQGFAPFSAANQKQ